MNILPILNDLFNVSVSKKVNPPKSKTDINIQSIDTAKNVQTKTSDKNFLTRDFSEKPRQSKIDNIPIYDTVEISSDNNINYNDKIAVGHINIPNENSTSNGGASQADKSADKDGSPINIISMFIFAFGIIMLIAGIITVPKGIILSVIGFFAMIYGIVRK